tara:strand:- start:253 stop:1077 length:825 start_codon:yes stop_codon:yes gene_type:complete
MKISVIIPTFNRAKLLERAIKSVLLQTYAPSEVIVIDDGSDDDTKEVVSKFDTVTYLYQDNNGVSAARNKAVHYAKGDWVSFLDSDDEWLPHKLQKQVELLNQLPNLNIVHGEEIWIRNGVRVNQMKKHKKSGGDIFIPSLKLCLISPSAVMIKRDFLISEGLFKEDFTVCEDYDLWLRLTSRFPVGFVEEPIIKKYGGHEDQLSRKYFAMDYWRVKSIDDVLTRFELSIERREPAIKVLLKKAKILLKGYEKHQNFKHFDEIKELLNKYQSTT